MFRWFCIISHYTHPLLLPKTAATGPLLIPSIIHAQAVWLYVPLQAGLWGEDTKGRVTAEAVSIISTASWPLHHWRLTLVTCTCCFLPFHFWGHFMAGGYSFDIARMGRDLGGGKRGELGRLEKIWVLNRILFITIKHCVLKFECIRTPQNDNTAENKQNFKNWKMYQNEKIK